MSKKSETKKYSIIEGDNNIVRKSNEFTRGKYATSTAFALQLVNISVTRISEEKDGTLSATLTPGELREIMHTTDKASLYKKLKKATKDITGSSAANNVFMEDGKGNFKFFTFITNAEYTDGVFKITFNKEMRNHLGSIKSSQGYTSYALANILDMNSPYSIRLYELLRSEIYKAGADSVVKKEFWVSELRFTIGLDELTQKMREAKDKGASWDEVADMVTGEQKYPGWRNFKRYVLDKAQEELTRYADVTFDYDLGRGGLGGRVERIIFYIRRNEAEESRKREREVVIEQINERHQSQHQYVLDDFDVIKELQGYVGHNALSGKDINAFLSDADGDVKKVEYYIQMADRQPYLTNYVGWIRDAIRNNYGVQETIEGSAERADRVRAAKAAAEQEKADPNGTMFVKLWAKTKEKPDYAEFLAYLDEISMSEDMIEEFYTAKDRVAGFVDWKKGGSPFQ